ncbi:conserved hypothetical protein [Ricinus communis]|uniref:Transmembrane protein n=1 Tax=Ricinus communis TaxID=3988 RepID=B9RPC3_RICCO|nr:conserved hypothetical protein [Ricinus communis]
MEEIEKEMKELKIIIKEQEDRLQNLQSSAFQLANFYFVFQGVILTTICNGNTSLHCGDAWFLFTLSLLAATLNLVALCKIGLKFKKTIAQHDRNWCDYNNLESERQRKSLPAASNRHRETIRNKDDACYNYSKLTELDDPYKEVKRNVLFFFCMALFVGFAGMGVRSRTCHQEMMIISVSGYVMDSSIIADIVLMLVAHELWSVEISGRNSNPVADHLAKLAQ